MEVAVEVAVTAGEMLTQEVEQHISQKDQVFYLLWVLIIQRYIWLLAVVAVAVAQIVVVFRNTLRMEELAEEQLEYQEAMVMTTLNIGGGALEALRSQEVLPPLPRAGQLKLPILKHHLVKELLQLYYRVMLFKAAAAAADGMEEEQEPPQEVVEAVAHHTLVTLHLE
jgi:hypothetical protein